MSVNPHWNHYNPVRIVAEPMECIGEYISTCHALLVTTPGMIRRGVASRVCRALTPAKVQIWGGVSPNPDLADLDLAAAQFRGIGFDMVVALGGGSAIDAGKALSILLAPENVSLTLDGILRKGCCSPAMTSLALTAIPTTAGTGSEVTPFATVWDRALQRKHSLSGDFIYPAHAFLDASLTLSLGWEDTLYPALDTVSHALESLWNRHRTPISQSHAQHSLVLSTSALPEALGDPTNLAARHRLQEAAMLAGLAISQTRTAIAHAISYPLTLRHSMPHGLACSFILPGLIERYKTHRVDVEELRILNDVANLLATLNLPNLASKFITRAEGLAKVEQMFTPERAGNCSFHVDHSLVERLIEESLPK